MLFSSDALSPQGDWTRALREDRDLARSAKSMLVTILFFGGLYGASLGIWRGPLQACFAAIKLPLFLAGTALLSAISIAALSMALGARLSLRQSLVMTLWPLTSAALILGSISPVFTFFAYSVTPPPGPGATPEQLAEAMFVGTRLLSVHIVAIAAAGMAGTLLLRTNLRRLLRNRQLAFRVLFVSLGVQLLAGSQLSWLMRPFLGKPDQPVSFFRGDAFRSGFVQEIHQMIADDAGLAGVAISLGVVALIALILVWFAPDQVNLNVEGTQLQIRSENLPVREVPLSWIISVRKYDCQVTVQIRDPQSVNVEELLCVTDTAKEAHELIELIERPVEAPYRRQAAKRSI